MPAKWTGDLIPALPGEAGRTSCSATICTYDGEGRSVGYVVPNADESHPPVALRLTGGHESRRHPGPPGPGRQLPLVRVERQVADYFPETGAGKGAGLLNQVITLPLDELREGDNLVELQAAGTWTVAYRVLVTGVDLVLDDRP